MDGELRQQQFFAETKFYQSKYCQKRRKIERRRLVNDFDGNADVNKWQKMSLFLEKYALILHKIAKKIILRQL